MFKKKKYHGEHNFELVFKAEQPPPRYARV